MVKLVYSCTVDGIIDGEPARDDRGSLIAQQRVNVYVNFPYGIISTVSVVVQHGDLQWLILQVLIIDLHSKRRGKDDKQSRDKGVREANSSTLCDTLK